MTTAEEQRVCTKCFRTLPVDEFRYRSRKAGQRHPECRQCNTVEQRLRKLKKRNQKAHDAAKRIVQQAENHLAIGAIVRGMIHELGGVDSYVAVWRAALAGAMEDGRHPTVLRSMSAIARLIEIANQPVDLKPIERMSDQELKAEVMDCLSHLTPDELAELGSG